MRALGSEYVYAGQDPYYAWIGASPSGPEPMSEGSTEARDVTK